jgi:succinate dehydrogenase / fumarate reductase iron-sulfur subunit
MADTRDALMGPRLAAALASCHDCRTEANCTEVCPKGISPTRAIKFIQRLAITAGVDKPQDALEPEKLPTDDASHWDKIDRATFLRGAGVAILGTGVAACLGAIAAKTTIGPAVKDAGGGRWIPLARIDDLPPGTVTTVVLNYDVKSGIYSQPVQTPVLISRLSDDIVCYKSACPHLGCTVRWDGQSDQYRCACHGGTFDRDASVIAGPPPRGLDRYQHKIEAGQLFVLVA